MDDRLIFVVADLHGRVEHLGEVLRAGGVLNSDGSRNYDVISVQLGDLANVVLQDEAGDCLALDLATFGMSLDELEKTTEPLHGWFDAVLVGNHEHPFFGGPRFNGYYLHPSVEHRMRHMEMPEIDLWRPAYCVPQMNLLITHAGWARDLKFFEAGSPIDPPTALDAYEFLQRAWRFDPSGPVFSQIGQSRGGWNNVGGVLWSDWSEAKSRAFNQLIGHTTDDDVRRRDYSREGTWSLCIDANAKRYGRITGCLIDPRAGTTEIITRPETT